MTISCPWITKLKLPNWGWGQWEGKLEERRERGGLEEVRGHWWRILGALVIGIDIRIIKINYTDFCYLNYSNNKIIFIFK